MTLWINIGAYAGFYVTYEGLLSWRVCLGWMAITLFPFDTDVVLGENFDRGDAVIKTGNALLGNIYDAEQNCNDDGVEYNDIKEFAAALDAFKAVQ